MLWNQLWPLLLAFAGSVVATPVVGGLAHRFNVIDIPGGRHQHERVVPKLGGLAIYLSLAGVALLAFPLSLSLLQILGAGLLFLLIGIMDDAYDISFWSKLLGQIAAATVFVMSGMEITTIANPWTSALLSLGMFSSFVTVMWITTVVNVTNLTDGIDGLVSGVTVISALVLAVLSIKTGHLETARLALILAGAVGGFLVYNFSPAKIFLGDSGTMLIGFMLAVLGFLGGAKLATALLVLGIPLLDGAFIIAYRWAKGKSIFQPDRNHLHFRLLDRGMNARQICLIFYSASTLLGLFAILMSGRGKLLTLGLLVVAFVVGVLWLSRWEKRTK